MRIRVTLRRLGRTIVHNWPLKLAAIAVASLLYAGLVLSQNAQRWDGQVPITPENIPTSAVLLSAPGNVTQIRYFAPADVASQVSSQTFTAYIDLSSVDPAKGPTYVPVHVQAADLRITIVDFQPTQVRVELDPLTTRSVPVQADYGTVPAGLQVGAPELSATTTIATGPQSSVDRVTKAIARVVIQPSGVSVDDDVSLVPLDALGERVTHVDLNPATVHVRIPVVSTARTRSLPVHLVTTGTPANGYVLSAVKVEPAVVTVSGNADTLATLTAADTAPVSIAGATSDVAATVPLALPTDITPVGEAAVTVTVSITAVQGTRTFQAGIVLSGARDDRTYMLSTDQVNVTLGGSLASLDSLDPTSFTVTADVAALPPGTHTVQLSVNLPAGLTVSAINPAAVGVTVAVAASPSPSPTPSPSPSPSASP
jgi:YbbR domain-containing protein